MNKIFVVIMSLFCTTIMASTSLEIIDPVVRLTPPKALVTAIFLKIQNNSGTDRKLVKVAGDNAKNFELHNMEMKDGSMVMRSVESILVKAKTTTTLASGGFHIMVFDVKSPLVEGAKFPITLHFDDKSVVKTEAIVKKL